MKKLFWVSSVTVVLFFILSFTTQQWSLFYWAFGLLAIVNIVSFQKAQFK